jgi:hypothetical protein
MRYSVCIIDNDIPASGPEAQAFGITDSGLLNASNLQLLLQKETWIDQVIKNLVETLLAQKNEDGISSKWDVYGFTNPSFYINAIDEGMFRSDVIVFDWDYPTSQNAPTYSESVLRQILDRTFCLVFIFSRADKEDEIRAVMAKAELHDYKERLLYLDKAKDGVDQTSLLLQKADEMYESNFSFKFASVLRRRSVQCADQILSDMGRASLNDVKNLLVVGDGGKKDFIDFLAERFRTSIAGPNVYTLVEQIPPPAADAPAPDPSIAAKVWSYRLYFQQDTGDELVRRGDIVKANEDFFLIMSADCDLGYFWKKNLGIINAVSLHDLHHGNTTLKALLTLCVEPKKLSNRMGSLLAKIGDLSEGPFVLPFVPFNNTHKNFVAIPKELLSIRIPLPSAFSDFTPKQKAQQPMKYAYWEGAVRLCTISEPFLTPVIQHVLNTMGGNGVPDYPEHMRDILKQILDDFSAPAATVTVTLAVPETQPTAVPALQEAEVTPAMPQEAVVAPVLPEAPPVEPAAPQETAAPATEPQQPSGVQNE